MLSYVRENVRFVVCIQAANLRGFRASVNPRFEAGIPDFMNGILNLSIHFNVVQSNLVTTYPVYNVFTHTTYKFQSPEFP